MSKSKKHDLKWLKETKALEENHNWKSTPDHQIFVAGRGALRFDVPQGWIFEPTDNSFRFFNDKPPHDDCRLEAAYNLLPPGNWQEFPIVPLLKKVIRDDPRQPIEEQGEIIRLKRQTARIVWTQIKFIDKGENREAYSRICIGLGSGVQCLISLDYWADDSDRFTPVWDVVMDSLTLGLYIRDPQTGFALPD